MNIVSLILAAGEASRFGSIKQLVDIGGNSMLNHVIAQHRHAGFSHIVVVLGANETRIKAQIDDNVDSVYCENWRLGMGESIRCGVDYICNQTQLDASHILISLADQIDVRALQIKTLISQACNNPSAIIAANYADSVGVPACFPVQMFSTLINLESRSENLQQGAKSVIQANSDNVIGIDMPEAKFDIDTCEDLRRWRKKLYDN